MSDELECRIELQLDATRRAEMNRLLLVLMPTIITTLGVALAIGKVT